MQTIELLTLKETAAQLRTPVGTLRYWRQTGTGPTSIKVGRNIMYRAEDVTSWLEGL